MICLLLVPNVTSMITNEDTLHSISTEIAATGKAICIQNMHVNMMPADRVMFISSIICNTMLLCV